MPTATLPRSAEDLVASELPSLARIRLLARIAAQDVHERRKLNELHKDGLTGVKNEKEVRQAILAYVLGYYADAEDLLDGKSNALAKAVLGLVFAALDEPDDAAKLFKAAAKELPEAHAEIVRAYLDADRLEDAEKALDDVPQGAEAEFLAGQIDERNGRTERAINAYESALEMDGKHVEAAFRLANLFDRIGDDDMAVEYYLVCADSWPPYIPGVINLGILYEERGEANAAIDCFRQALAFNPDNERAKLLLRDAQASRSMFYDEKEEREREQMQKILKTSVNDFELSVRSRNCLAKMNIFTLGDLISITEQEMLNYKNFGETSLKEVKEMLDHRNLRLGMLREREERTLSKADQKVLNESIEKLELSDKCMDMLGKLGVTRIGDLEHYDDLQLYRAEGSGQTVVQELSTAMGAIGFKLETPQVRM
ncbi:MAG: DNA-directed RNA polymerase subunit alpha C-terminal domain-containing protein [Planctomycetota bacterium]